MVFDQQLSKRILKRLTETRAVLLGEFPFFGTLLMMLKFGLAKCETAFTDMKRIVFDPDFAERLDDEELQFVLFHEVMHCVLQHCTRGKNYQSMVYNIACDIVVNSMILEIMGETEFTVDGCQVMHLAPDGKEGREYSAEEIYFMLLDKCKDDASALPAMFQSGVDAIDTHDPWVMIPQKGLLEDEWKDAVIAVAGEQFGGKRQGKGSLPNSIRELLKGWNYRSKLDWRSLLREFIQINYDEFDYTYNPPERKYIPYDIFMQSFRIVETEVVKDVWFCVDASGSISPKQLNVIFAEIKQAVEQFHGLSGSVSFFDTKVTKPQPFEDLEELENIQAKGGGGTDFHAIFQYMENNMQHDLPVGVIILTDGYAEFPEEEAAYGVPVLWVIVDSKRQAPWGMSIQVNSREDLEN